jgi:DNA-binding CsgD family transcriptional regulator
VDTTQVIEQLSEREREILALMAKRRTNAEIGEQLDLRFDTVKWYVSEILSKLGVGSREQAAEAWREYRRPWGVFSRRLRALTALPVAKLGVALAGTAAAGGLVVAAVGGGLGGDGGVAVDPAPTPQITVNPDVTAPTAGSPGPPLTVEEMLARVEPIGPFVDIVSSTFEGITHTFGMYEARLGLCGYTWDSLQGSPAVGGVWSCSGPMTEPRLLAGQTVSRGGPLTGIVEPHIVRVRIVFRSGPAIELDTVAAPPALDLAWRFWIVAVERPDRLVRVEGLDASGNVVESQGPLAPP